MMFLVAIATGSWAEVVSYNIWVAGTQVNSSNATDVLGDGTVSYDASNGTLTLNNASITTACDEFIRSGYWGTRTGIRANQDLTIVLTGSNTIDLSALTYNRVMRHSIFVNGNLTIKGTGSLVARSGAATNNNSSDYRESTAIHAEGTLTFDGDVTVEAVGGTSECDSAGLRGVSGGVVVKGNASVVSEGSAVTVKSRTSLGAWCNVTVQGGSFVGFGKISACGTLTVPTGYYIYSGDDEASATLQSGTSYSGSNAKYVKATGTAAHTHNAGDAVQENMVGPSCTTDGQYDVVVYCTGCGEEMSRNTQYIPALGHDLTHVPEVPATTTAEGMKEHYTCSRCTDLLDMNYATVTASDLIIPMLVEPEAYAALSNDNKTLTFYYDGQKASRNGMSVGPFIYSDDRGWHNLSEEITTVVFDASFANYKPTSTKDWFSNCKNLTTFTGIENLKTDEVTDISNMFYNCNNLTSLDLSSFNTAKVTNMGNMFRRCTRLTSLDLSSFNTGKVTYMNGMFSGCSSLTSLDLSSFNTANVNYMNDMFYTCSNLTSIDLSSFNTSNVISMRSMFYMCSSLKSLDLGSFNTEKVTDMYEMFRSCAALTRIAVDPDKWDTSKVTNGVDMFKGCYNLVGGNGTTYVNNNTSVSYAVIDKDGTLGYLTDVNAPVVLEAYATLSNDNKTLTFYYDYDKIIRKGMSVGPFTSSSNRGWNNQRGTITTVVFDASFANYKPTSTAYWFYNFNYLTTITGIENLKTDEVTNMESMFYECRSLTNLDLSSFNTANVTNMGYMFGDCYSLTNLDLSSFNTANVEYMGFMFGNCYSLTSLDLSSFNTVNVTNMAAMFRGCSGLTSLDLSIFNTANVKFTYEMFYGCSSLTSLDLSSFNTANVTGMGYMFYNCSGLTSLDLSSFNTENVTSMSYMFCGCTALTKITVDPNKWDTSKVTYSEEMFKGCTNLVGGNGTTYDANHTDVAYAVIDKDGTPGYLTDVNVPVEPEAYAVLSGDGKTLTFYYDMEKASSGGMSVGPFDGNTTLPAWSDKASGIRNANIDESFAGYTALTSTAYWFEGCSEIKAVSGLENLVMDNVTDMSNMFKGCNNLRSVSLSGMNTGKVTNMHGLFWDCNALQTIDLSTLDTRSVTDMSGMFNYCNSLKTVDLSGVNTASVTDMNNMFYYCSSLTDLDLSSFNTASVTNMRYMFEGCSSLTKITVSETGWTTKAVNSGTAMFSGCRDIVGGNGTTYDAGHTDEGYARIDKAGTPGYLTSSAGTGINLLKTTPGGDGYFYTPDGRRIEGKPTKQGFYITNGRKVMAK